MNTEIYSKLFERFPLLALQVGNAQGKKERRVSLPEIDLSKINALYIYGMRADYYAKCSNWLKENSFRKLIFLSKNLASVAAFLEDSSALDILSNPQIHIELFTPDLIEALADKFPFHTVEVIGAPAEVRLNILKKTSYTSMLHLDRLEGHILFKQFLQNLPHLERSYYANGLKDAFKNVPAVICGAGPSLASSIESLKTLGDKALVIAGGSSVSALKFAGAPVHFAMAIDPNKTEYHRFKNGCAADIPFLYSTRLYPEVFKTLNGPLLYMRSGIGGLLEIWFEEALQLKEQLIGQNLSTESMSVTCVCIAYAQFLGCNPILLNGIDMAYTNKTRYAPGVSAEEPLPEQVIGDIAVETKNAAGEVVNTAVRWITESSAISHFAEKHREVRFINTTSQGLGFKNIPYMPLQKAIKDFTLQNFDIESKIKSSPMPENTKQIIEEKIEELHQSLNRSIEHLEILLGEKKGSKALAEVELYEEIATIVLFYDLSSCYQTWKERALQYREILIQR